MSTGSFPFDCSPDGSWAKASPKHNLHDMPAGSTGATWGEMTGTWPLLGLIAAKTEEGKKPMDPPADTRSQSG